MSKKFIAREFLKNKDGFNYEDYKKNFEAVYNDKYTSEFSKEIKEYYLVIAYYSVYSLNDNEKKENKFFDFSQTKINRMYEILEAHNLDGQKQELIDLDMDMNINYYDCFQVLTRALRFKEAYEKQKLKTNKEFTFGEYTQTVNNTIIQKLKTDDRYFKVANCSFGDLEILEDVTKYFKRRYNLTYYDGIKRKEIHLKSLEFQEVIDKLQESDLFLNRNDIEDIFNKLLFHYTGYGLEVTETVFKQGFFIDTKTNKVIENTDIKDLKPNNYQVKESISLLNKLIQSRPMAKELLAEIYRFGLYSPFYWCLKELGLANNNTKGLIITGKPQTAKTITAVISLRFYIKPDVTDIGASTVSILGEKIEASTFPTICDEAHYLLNQPETASLLKRSAFNKIAREVKNDKRLALSPAVLTINENYKLLDGMQRRYKVLTFDTDTIITDEEAIEFDTEFSPMAIESPLNDLRYLGARFRDKIIPLIENKDKRLSNIDKLAIDLLKEISEEVKEPLDCEILKAHEFDNLLIDDPAETLKQKLNSSCRRHIKTTNKVGQYTERDLITASQNGVFNWLHYQETNELFVINSNEFLQHCKVLLNDSGISINEISKYLSLDITSKDIKPIKVNNTTIRGFKVDVDRLANNIFNINLMNLEENEDLYNYY